MSYTVRLKASATKDLTHVRSEYRQRITAVIEDLAQDPRPFGSADLAGQLRGYRRIRVGGYRIGYRIDDDSSVVVVFAIGPRERFYEMMVQRGG